MTIYLVLSALTSSPVSLVAATKAIQDDFNVNTKQIELNKHKDLEIEVSGMWKVRTKIVSDISGALRTIK